MKKIFIIIFLILAIFQLVVLAIAIDIGSPAINRAANRPSGDTRIILTNPANETGIINTIEIWAVNNLSGVEVATFYLVSGDNYATRDYETIGSVTGGSKQTFSVNLDVQAGDYIGAYWTDGYIECDTSGGSGYMYLSGDYIPTGSVTFNSYTSYVISLYGTGTTAVGWAHKWNTKTISKWNTKEFTKWNGLE